MYIVVPSQSGGMNSVPSCWKAGQVTAKATMANRITVLRQRKAAVTNG